LGSIATQYSLGSLNCTILSARILYTTMNTHLWIGRIIASILSLLQATTLRDRYYTALQRIELLETAIDDIGRINSQSAKNPLIQGIVDRLRNKHGR